MYPDFRSVSGCVPSEVWTRKDRQRKLVQLPLHEKSLINRELRRPTIALVAITVLLNAMDGLRCPVHRFASPGIARNGVSLRRLLAWCSPWMLIGWLFGSSFNRGVGR